MFVHDAPLPRQQQPGLHRFTRPATWWTHMVRFRWDLNKKNKINDELCIAKTESLHDNSSLNIYNTATGALHTLDESRRHHGEAGNYQLHFILHMHHFVYDPCSITLETLDMSPTRSARHNKAAFRAGVPLLRMEFKFLSVVWIMSEWIHAGRKNLNAAARLAADKKGGRPSPRAARRIGEISLAYGHDGVQRTTWSKALNWFYWSNKWGHLNCGKINPSLKYFMLSWNTSEFGVYIYIIYTYT